MAGTRPAMTRGTRAIPKATPEFCRNLPHALVTSQNTGNGALTTPETFVRQA
jgi:hypothetical protein